MTESEKTKPSTPPPTQYPQEQESWESENGRSGTYQPPPPYLGSIPTKPGKGRRTEKQSSLRPLPTSSRL
jgi:hypothetical protein